MRKINKNKVPKPRQQAVGADSSSDDLPRDVICNQQVRTDIKMTEGAQTQVGGRKRRPQAAREL